MERQTFYYRAYNYTDDNYTGSIVLTIGRDLIRFYAKRDGPSHNYMYLCEDSNGNKIGYTRFSKSTLELFNW